MMKTWFTMVIVVVFASLFIAEAAKTQKHTGKRLSLRKPAIVDQVWVGYNNWRYVMRNDGVFMLDAASDIGWGPGGEFPRGSGETVMYSAGVWVGTIKDGIAVVSNADPSGGGTTWQPGSILNTNVPFQQLIADSVGLPNNKVYMIDQTREGSDWVNWPGDRDSAGNPLLIAEGQTWAVFNDLDTTLNWEGARSPNQGLGLNVILESFAFNRGPAANTVILKFTIENRTNRSYPASYFGFYSDPDVKPNFQDDLSASDTLRGLGYVYNATNTDIPGAVGFDILQGPISTAVEAGAYYAEKFVENDTVIRYDPASGSYRHIALPAGKFSIGATVIATFVGGANASNDQQRYWRLEGRDNGGDPLDGTGMFYKYVFPGDPVTQPPGSSLTDPVAPLAIASDHRMIVGSGPFTIEANGKQEVWVGVIGSGGRDRLDAIVNLRVNNDAIQRWFEAGMPDVATPPAPKLSVSAQDGSVILTWDNSAELTEDTYGERLGINTANRYSANYIKDDFQGYRVYRSRTGLEGSFQRMAQYDRADGITQVSDTRLLEDNQTATTDWVDLGSDSGLRYHYVDSNLTNGQTYYYAVTAYDAQPDIRESVKIRVNGMDSVYRPLDIPISLESAREESMVKVVPMAMSGRVKTDEGIGSVSHALGSGDGTVEIGVVDRQLIREGEYEVRFFELPNTVNGKAVMGITPGDVVFYVRHSVLGDRMFSNKVDDPATFLDGGNGRLDYINGQYMNGDEPFDDRLWNPIGLEDEAVDLPICDGLFFKVANAKPGVKDIFAANTWFSGPGALNYGNGIFDFTEQFWGTGGVAEKDRHDLDLIWSRTPSNWSMIYRHGTSSTASVNDTCLAPFRVLDVDSADGEPTPRRLNVNFRDRDNFDAWTLDGSPLLYGEGRYNYTYFLDMDYDGGTTHFDTIGVPTKVPSYGVMWLGYNPDYPGTAELHGRYVAARDPGSDGGTAITYAERYDIYRNWISHEDTLKIRVKHVFIERDVYRFTAVGMVADDSKASKRKSLEDIRVVPNPFYKYSRYDTDYSKKIKFTHLPAYCTIKIFTVSGDLVKILRHHSVSNNDRVDSISDPSEEPQATTMESWDLRNDRGKLVASGMYVALIEAAGIGKTTVKFAIVQ